MRPNTQEVFFNRTRSDTSGCLLWQGRLDKDGYGIFRWYGKYERAHRLVWQWQHGPIDSSICVLHRCDVPACVLIDHLFLGTHQQNIADKVAKNRQARGEANGRAKLTRATAEEIRKLAGTMSQSQLAQRYGVSKRAIQFLLSGVSWR